MRKIDDVFLKLGLPLKSLPLICVADCPQNHPLCRSDAERDVLVLSTTGNHERVHGRILPAI
jgi:hypothetical protein